MTKEVVKRAWFARPGEAYHSHLFSMWPDGRPNTAVCGVLGHPDDEPVGFHRSGRICIYCRDRERPS